MNKSNSKKQAMRKMIKFILPAAVVVFSTSCGEPSGDENSDLSQLQAEKARFKDSVAFISAKIEAIDTAKKKSYPKVTLHAVEPTFFEHYFSAQGYLESEKNVILTPEAGGLVRSLGVSEGENIAKDHVVASFDSEIVNSNINELEEQLKLAKYNFDKQQKLYEQGVGTEFNLKQAEGQYNGLQKTLQTLRTQKGKSTLVAPFSGYVEEVFPTVGEMVGPGMPVARLINLDEVYVAAEISEVYLGKLNLNNQASVSFSALDEVVDSLTISQIGKYVNPANRTLKVKVKLPKNEKFIPNLVATIRIRDYSKDSSMIVPSSSISQDSKGNDIVFVAEGGPNLYTVKQVGIETGYTYKGMTEIKRGLAFGANVIDQGSQSVYDGLEVERLK